MNILLLSCSYGVPHFIDYQGTQESQTIENYLSKHHTVFNLSTNGSSNWEAIDRAHEFIDGNIVLHIPCGVDAYKEVQKPADINIDYVIWICTSLLRDQQIVHVPTLDQCIAEIQVTTYNKIKELMQKIPTAKLIAVGGCGPIDETALRKVLPVHYCVPDWRADLLDMEYTEHLSGGAKLNLNDLITDPRLSGHVAMAQTVYTNMHSSDAFPDSSHPGSSAHKGLYEKIIPYISI